MLKVYIVRHGESETNQKGLWTGWLDVNLTDAGKKQAQSVGEYLSKIKFDKIYSSDLVRARQTAENALAGCNYETLDLLREINVGTIAGESLSIITDEQRKVIFKDGYTIFDGESKADFANRVLAFMKSLESEKCENVAVFTHNGFLRTFFDTVAGVYIPRKSMLCKNCTVAIFEYTDDIWRLHIWMNLF